MSARRLHRLSPHDRRLAGRSSRVLLASNAMIDGNIHEDIAQKDACDVHDFAAP
jgi:hypothetical protein